MITIPISDVPEGVCTLLELAEAHTPIDEVPPELAAAMRFCSLQVLTNIRDSTLVLNSRGEGLLLFKQMSE